MNLNESQEIHDIVEAMLNAQVQQGNKRNPRAFLNYLTAGRSEGCFSWSSTSQGQAWWQSNLGSVAPEWKRSAIKNLLLKLAEENTIKKPEVHIVDNEKIIL